MDIRNYKNRVKQLFRDGAATEEQWEEMAEAVLWVSESEYRYDTVSAIDRVVVDDEESEAGIHEID